MSFERVTKPDLTVNNIAGLADRPQLTAADLKAKFDKAGGDLLTFLEGYVEEINDLISALEDSTAAGNLGADAVWDEDSSESNVQAKLAALKTYMDGLVITAGAGDMLKSVFAKLDPASGKVDKAVDADKLGGTAASGYAKEIAAQAAKSTLSDNDAFPLSDSAASGVQKKTLWSTIIAAIQTVFTNTFSAKSHTHGAISNTGGFVVEPTNAGNCFVAWDIDSKIHLKAAGAGRTAFGLMPNNANQGDFESPDTFADSDIIPVYDVSTDVQKKATIGTILAGTVKNTAGIRITVSNTEPTNPSLNDLWFADET